jgi:FkbM family methyltransferase
VELSSGFFKRRLQDRLAADDRGNAPSAPPTRFVASEDVLLAIPDDAEFVRQAYLYFLRREPDLDGLQYFSEAILNRGRQSVVDELKESSEAREMGHADQTQNVDLPAINFAEERAQDRRMLALSGPFELTGLLTIAGDDAFVSALYEGALGRAVDPEGLAHHLAQLSQGVSRDALTQGLALSPEARAIGRPFTWQGQPWPPLSRVNRIRRTVRRLLSGAESPAATPLARHQDRVHERLLHRLADERETLAGIERSVADLQQALDDLRSKLVTSAHLEALPAYLESLTQKQEGTARSLASLTTDLTKELQQIRDDMIAAAKRTAALPARTSVLAGDNVVATEVNGFIVGVPGEEWRLAAFHAFRGVLEPGLTRRFTESLAPGMTVVDVGANVGMYTLIAGRAVAPTGKVFSFEPTPRTFAILKDNIQVNGMLETGLIDYRQMAVTDRRGTARLAVYRDNGGHNTLFADGPGPGFIDVETIALDDALAGVARVNVIKIDAEGAEPLIWNGMGQILRKNPAVKVFMEFAPSLLARAGQDPGEFLDRLAADGFRIQRVHDESGALMADTRESLCRAFSANILLTRGAA